MMTSLLIVSGQMSVFFGPTSGPNFRMSVVCSFQSCAAWVPTQRICRPLLGSPCLCVRRLMNNIERLKVWNDCNNTFDNLV